MYIVISSAFKVFWRYVDCKLIERDSFLGGPVISGVPPVETQHFNIQSRCEKGLSSLEMISQISKLLDKKDISTHTCIFRNDLYLFLMMQWSFDAFNHTS